MVKVGIKKDQDELTVLTKLNENLIQIAEAGNGTYTKTKDQSQIWEIIDRINKTEKHP